MKSFIFVVSFVLLQFLVTDSVAAPKPDTTAPSVSSNVDSNTVVSKNTVRITVSDKSDFTTQVFKDGLLIQTSTSKHFDLNLAEGVNNFIIKSKDTAGNESADFILANIVLDKSAPVISSSLASGAYTNVNKIQIAVSDSSDVSTRITTSATAFATTNKQFELTLNEGANRFVLTSTDSLKNKSEAFVIENVILDTIAPKITSNVQSNAIVPSGKFMITIDDVNSVATQVFRNGGLIATQTSKVFDVELVAGRNDFVFKSIDAAQNTAVDLILNRISIVSDSASPVLTSNLSSNVITNVPRISFTISDQSSVSTQVFNNGSLVTTEQSKTFDIVLVEGVNSLVLKSKDEYDNQTADFLVSNVVLDTVAPKISSNVSSQATVLADKIQISIVDATAVATQVYKNGELIATETSKNFEIPLTPGSNSFVLKSVDAASNKSVDFVLSDVILKARDSSPPEILAYTVYSGIFTLRNKIPITIRDDSAVTTKIFKDGSLVSTEVVKEFELTLTEGLNNFVIISTDSEGNDSTLELSSISYTSQAPIVVSPEPGSAIRSYLYLQTAGGPPGAILQTIINYSSTFLTFVSPDGYTFQEIALDEGANHLELKFEDYTGSFSPSTFLTIFLDTRAPQISVAHDPEDRNHVTVTISDISSVIFVNIFKDNEFTALQDKKIFDLNLEPMSSYRVQAMDEVGNISELTFSGEPEDSVAPQIIVTSHSAGIFTNNNILSGAVIDDSITNTYVYRNDRIKWAEKDKEFQIPLLEGVNNVRIVAIDIYENISILQIENITVDTIAPTISSNIQSNSTVTTGKVQFTITDATSVTTQVFKNGVLITTETAEVFEVGLSPGINDLILKSVDVAQNTAVDFVLSDVVLQSGDMAPPVITSTRQSNDLTVSNKFQISISDESAVTTQVYKDSILVLTTESKSFELSLDEGSNNFRLVSVDAAQNQAPDFYLSNIVLSYKLPRIEYDSPTRQATGSLRSFLEGSLYDGMVQITRNGVMTGMAFIGPDGLSSISFDLFEGVNNFEVTFHDRYGNASLATPFSINLDSIAPGLLCEASANKDNIHVKVMYEDSPTNSKVESDGNVIFQTNEKEWDIAYPPFGSTYYITARDEIGNYSPTCTFEGIEPQIKPTITTNRNSNTSTANNVVQVSISGGQLVATRVFKDGILFDTTTTKYFELTLEQGVNNFTIVSTDALGYIAEYQLVNLVYNPVVPRITSNLYTTNNYTNVITLSESSAYDTIEIDHDEQFMTGGGYPISDNAATISLPLAEGSNNYYVRFRDQYGNVSSSVPFTFILDTVQPMLISDAQSNTVIDKDKIHITILDSSPTYTELVVNGVVQGITDEKEWDIPLPEMGYYSRVISVDAAGNVTELILSNIRQNILPVISTNLQSSYHFDSLPQTVNIIVETNKILNSLMVNGEPLIPTSLYTYSYQAKFDQVGIKEFNFVAIDGDGNQLSVNQPTLITVDQLPIITANRNSNESTVLSNLHIVISDETAVTNNVYRDGVLISTTSEKEFDVVLVEGINNLMITSLNSNGKDASLEIANLVLNTTLPTIDPVMDGRNPIVNFHVSGHGSLYTQFFEVSRDGAVISTGIFDSEGEGWLQIGLNLGMNNFEVKFYDEAGNVSPPVPVNILFDNVLPQIFADVDSGTITNKEKIHITVVDNDFIYAQVVMDGVILGITDEKEWDIVIPEGVITFSVTAVDVYGNAITLNLENLIVDRTKPIISTNLQTHYQFDSFPQSETLNISFNEPVQKYSINGQEFYPLGAVSFPYSIQFDGPGIKSYTLIAEDLAGNVSIEEISVEAVLVNPEDKIAPSISSSLASNTFTNKNLIHISIQDESSVTTYVYQNNTIMYTFTEKEFDIPLWEGANSFTIRSKDLHGNQSEDFTLSSIVLDVAAPALTTDLKSEYRYSSLPKTEMISIQSNESLQSLTVNGLALNPASLNSYSYQLQFDTEALKLLTFVATDFAGNQTVLQKTVQVVLQSDEDKTAPTINPNLLSYSTTNKENVHITIQDASSATTYVYQNSNLKYTFQSKEFEIPLLEGFNSFTIRSIDAHGNTSPDLVLLNIERDTVVPSFTTNLNLQYTYTKLPKAETIIVDVSEQVQSLSINGKELIQLDWLRYVYTVEFNEAGYHNFVFKALDFAGNENVVQLATNVTLNVIDDTSPPLILTNVTSNQETDNPYLEVTISDQLDVETTVIDQFGQTRVYTEKSFLVQLDYGPNSFNLESVDQYGNKANLSISNLFFNPNNGLPYFYTNFPDHSYIFTSSTSIRINTIGTSSKPYLFIKTNGVSFSQAPLPWKGEFDVPLVEGENTISGDFVDSSNNYSPFFVLRSVIRDTIDPILTSNIPASRFSNQAGFVFETFDVNLYTVTLSIDGQEDNSSYLDYFYVPLAEGKYQNVRVVALDDAGNKTIHNYGDVTIDRTPPSFTTNLQAQYELNVLPHRETLTVQLNEPVQTLSINGKSLIPIGPNTYSYTLEFSDYGLKQFTTIAVDFAGNETVQQDYVNILIDSTAPVIYASEPPAFITEDIFNVSVTVSDDQDVTTRVFIDGNLEITQTDKSFYFDVVFDPLKAIETKSVKMISVDIDDKMVEKYFVVVKNKTPLAVQVLSPNAGTIVESEEVRYHLIANKALQSATINGNPVNINADQISFEGILYQSSDGQFTANVVVTDIYGQIATTQLQAEVKTSRIPAWDYKECPIEQ